MHVVTGGAGFIGSNIVRALNARGITDILVVDHLERGEKFFNLNDCRIADYMDRQEFLAMVEKGGRLAARAILHQGACVDTTEFDGRYMMENNFTYSKRLLHYALQQSIPFVYASSGSVYGTSRQSRETPENERPINVYAYSKYVFDSYVRRLLPSIKSTVVGLRYFNVYGPREHHKGKMASMVFQLYRQIVETGVARLFEGTDGYADGEQRRDFVFVEDVVRVNLFYAEGPARQAIVNVGTGVSRSFNDVAQILIRELGRGSIEYIPFPESLRGKYQSFTEADLTALRRADYSEDFVSLEEGIKRSVQAWQHLL